MKSGMMQMTGTLPKPKKIGSIKNGKVNYPQDQNFFHSSDIPVDVYLLSTSNTPLGQRICQTNQRPGRS